MKKKRNRRTVTRAQAKNNQNILSSFYYYYCVSYLRFLLLGVPFLEWSVMDVGQGVVGYPCFSCLFILLENRVFFSGSLLKFEEEVINH